MDLVEFLLARIAEDEVAARAVVTGHPMHDWESYMSSAGWYGGSASKFAERFDPDRVLAECAAKRRIVEAYRTSWYARGGPTLDTVGWADQQEGKGRALERVLRLLALPYADHEDYRQEWALTGAVRV